MSRLHKLTKTPLGQLGGITKRVSGHRDPHVFHNGTRYDLSVADAWELSVRYARRIFEQKFGIKLMVVDHQPRNIGECQIVELQTPKGSRDFRVRFYHPNFYLGFRVMVESNSAGIAYRDIFDIVGVAIEDGPGELDTEYVKDITATDPAEAMVAQDAAVRAQHEQALTAERLKQFPQWYQKKFKLNISWEAAFGVRSGAGRSCTALSKTEKKKPSAAAPAPKTKPRWSRCKQQRSTSVSTNRSIFDQPAPALKPGAFSIP